ncbi:twin-arginine translocation signal domain-containing protein [Aeromonas rivipollensis]|uniref:twin-arginine translocation signal domain-containing protein n=1 Tax=Aeromonas rivipollensis TaxID=948519 RepID=UPI0038D1910B
MKFNRRGFLKFATATLVTAVGTVNRLVYASNDRKQESEFSVLSCVSTPLRSQSELSRIISR